MYLWLLAFLASAFSATLNSVGAQCDLGKALQCNNRIVPSSSLKETCRRAQEAVDCVKDAIKDCPDVSQSTFEKELKNVTQLMATYGCQELNSSTADCDVSSIQQCNNAITQVDTVQEFCRLADDVISCYAQKTSHCPDFIKDLSRTSTDEINGIKRDKGCSGVAGVMSSLALCLQLSGLAYILSRLT